MRFPASHVVGKGAVRRAWVTERVRRESETYLLMVSESPITQRCRFGRVIATVTAHQYFVFFEGMNCDSRIPFSRLFSPRNPTSRSALLRTVLTITASFSRP